MRGVYACFYGAANSIQPPTSRPIATETTSVMAEKMRKPGVPVREAVERYIIPEKYKPSRQFSSGFSIGRIIKQSYADSSGKTDPVLNYS
jgi:hypothetical protein